MDLLVRAILGLAVIVFLQHGFSAIVGGKSIIDSIIGSIGKTSPSERNDGVTGRIAPPANRVQPKTEAKKEENEDNVQP